MSDKQYGHFGHSVSVSGDFVVVGERKEGIYEYDDSTESAYVYVSTSNGWYELQNLTAFDGADYDNFGWADYDRFGWAVDVSEEVLVIGSRNDDDRGSNSGSAYVFYRDDATTTQ